MIKRRNQQRIRVRRGRKTNNDEEEKSSMIRVMWVKRTESDKEK